MGWVLGVSLAVALGAAITAAPGDDTAGGRPRLALRATPRLSFSPANVFVVAEVKGSAGEDLYCPGLDWEWGDGSRSAEEGDCPPYREGASVERFYRARHAYRRPGQYDLTLTLRRAERTVAVARMQIVVMGSGAP